MKRFLIIFIGIAAVALLALLGYYFYSKNAAPAASNPGSTTGGLPNPGNQNNPQQSSSPSGIPGSPVAAPAYTGQKFGVVAQNQVLAYYVDPQNNAFLVQPDGQVFEVANGTASALGSSTIPNLISAGFSHDGEKILGISGNPSDPQISVFTSSTSAWQPLAQGILSPVWSPINYQIAYLAPANGAVTLTTIDLSNPKARPVSFITLHAQDLALRWVSANQIILSEKTGAASTGSTWSYDLKKKVLSELVSEQSGLDTAWSGPAASGLVFEGSENGIGGRLTLVGASGSPLENLSFLTLPEKCAFDTELVPAASSTEVAASSTAKSGTKIPLAPTSTLVTSLYCGIPRDAQKLQTSALPDDYLMRSFFTADDLYKVDLASGNTSQIFADQNQTLDTTDLSVANQTLFFVNRIDQRLYAVSLK
ncbi:MAG TPA: hypothetical protein VNG29_00020 [Candidatus Paceibacterota bacterium]|nr:hypothetical protein [Candidatus Paceibacterota bacterium]